MNIDVISIGSIEEKVLDWVEDSLREGFECEVQKGEYLLVPPEAYDEGRGQYDSDFLLSKLASIPNEYEKIIFGITKKDIFSEGYNFIFGQASSNLSCGLVSIARLNPEFWGDEYSELVFKERVIIEVVHEVGHILGLPHCPDERCVMHFSNSINDTDVKGSEFCEECKKKRVKTF